jgi:hypothetical protein
LGLSYHNFNLIKGQKRPEKPWSRKAEGLQGQRPPKNKQSLSGAFSINHQPKTINKK